MTPMLQWYVVYKWHITRTASSAVFTVSKLTMALKTEKKAEYLLRGMEIFGTCQIDGQCVQHLNQLLD